MISPELKEQVEAAFDYRGHVTLKFIDNTEVVGFLFNRDDDSVELILEGSADKKAYAIANITSIELTGKDEADGKSYEDWQKKKEHERSQKDGN